MGSMKEWEVWCEGYQATGENGPACLMATVIAASFREACAISAQEFASPDLYDPVRNTYWACRLFGIAQEQPPESIWIVM